MYQQQCFDPMNQDRMTALSPEIYLKASELKCQTLCSYVPELNSKSSVALIHLSRAQKDNCLF